MANLLNSSWRSNIQTSKITITTSNTSVHFKMSGTNQMACAKACIPIDASKYKEISLTYSSGTSDGITDLYFNVFDNMVAQYYANTEYDQGISSESLAGVNTKAQAKIDTKSSGTITITIPSNATGMKYVGFLFYGNTYNQQYSTQRKVNITSLTAVERGHTLTYDANGGSDGPSSESDVTSTIISSTVPTRDGYYFLGWSASSYATSASYVAGSTITLSADTTLYAVWAKLYTVIYDANGGSNAPSLQEKIPGEDLTLTNDTPTPPGNTFETYIVTFNANGGICDQDMLTATHNIRYEFNLWSDSPYGSFVQYKPGALYTDDSDITLYALYSMITSYNSIVLPTPTRSGYEFLGWSIDEYDISGITGKYTPEEDVVFYAIWKCKGLAYITDSYSEQPNPYIALIKDGSDWNQYVPYIYTESGWTEYFG